MSNERDNEFLYNFLIICRYFNLVCNKRIILKQAEHSEVIKIFKFWTAYGGKYVIFVELSRSGNLLCTIRGDNIYYTSILRPLLLFIYAYQGNYYSCGTRQLPLAEQELLFIPENPSFFIWRFSFLCSVYRPLVSYVIKLLHCLSFLDLWLLVNPLVSSKLKSKLTITEQCLDCYI